MKSCSAHATLLLRCHPNLENDTDSHCQLCIHASPPLFSIHHELLLDREQPNGELTSWSLALPVDGTLPFFKSPYIGHVDVSGHMQHQNGARRLAGFTLVVPDIKRARDELARTLAIAPRDETSFCIRDVEVRLTQGPTRSIERLQLVSEGQTGMLTLAGAPVELVAAAQTHCAHQESGLSKGAAGSESVQPASQERSAP